MNTKTLKGVENQTWRRFKSIAAKQGMTMGTLFKNMVEIYDQEDNSFWDDVLSRKSLLSEEEANKLAESTKKLRLGKGFRQ